MIKHIVVIIFAAFFSEVAPWTLNFPEIKKFILERAEVSNQPSKTKINKNDEFYDVSKYAKDFNYQNLNIREVQENSILSSGSSYLDGLSSALLEYKQTMDDCRQSRISSNYQTRPIAQFLRRGSRVDPCEQVLQNSEGIRQLSELLMITTGTMQDKTNKNNKDQDETALLARLAWLLDKLAQLTGYKPKNSTNIAQDKSTNQNLESPLEIMEPVENGRLSKLPPKTLKTKTKRSVSNPLEEVANYYLKYKAWTHSNPEDIPIVNNKSNYEVENSLKVKPIKKRSVNTKKALNVRIVDNEKKDLFFHRKPETLIKSKIILHRILGATLKVKNKIIKAKKAIKHV